MMILLVEDDPHKSSRVQALLETIIKDISLTVCDNVKDGVRYLKAYSPEKIIIDMSLPSHAGEHGGGSPLSMPSGGIELILRIRKEGKYATPIIILTQYPDIEIEGEYYSVVEAGSKIMNIYSMSYVVAVHYDADSTEWEKKLGDFLVK